MYILSLKKMCKKKLIEFLWEKNYYYKYKIFVFLMIDEIISVEFFKINYFYVSDLVKKLEVISGFFCRFISYCLLVFIW